ncbi:MAG TPA: hypothetical protein VND97_08050 [Beijerinckiaceae bacterium]|nr:hypothetical protein [Beijerinckiaceae bacterium]
MGDSTELIEALEPSQLTANAERRLPRRRLGGGTLALLILLRIYVLIAIPLVGYAFVQALTASH